MHRILPPYLGENYDSHWGPFSFEGKTILDIGADYGSTVSYFLQKGAKKVIAVEADPELFSRLVKNYGEDTSVITINLQVSESKHFEDLIHRYNPDILKTDCEGCELILTRVDNKILKKVPEYLVETHDHISSCGITPQIESLFKKIRYSYKTYEVIPNIRVVHAKKTWDIYNLSEQDMVSLKNELLLNAERTHVLLKNDRDGLKNDRDGLKNERDGLKNERDGLKDECDGLRKELLQRCLERDSLITELRYIRFELDNIKNSFGYKWMRFYAKIIDRAFPDGTRRGEFRKIFVRSIGIASSQGVRSLLRMMWQKLRRGELKIVQPALQTEGGSIIISPREKILLSCDVPRLSLTNPAKVPEMFIVTGWVLAHREIREVDIYLDDVRIGPAEYGIVRLDVGGAYPEYPNSTLSGFSKFIDVDAEGIHRLKIVVRCDNLPPVSLEGLIEVVDIGYLPQTIEEEYEHQTLDEKLSVVILTRWPPFEFNQTLERVRAQKSLSEVELIIINSGESDLSSIAKKYNAIVYGISPKEFEHGATRNYAAEKSGGDYIFFMTDDAIPTSNYLFRSMIDVLRSDRAIAAVSARQIPRTDADLMYCQAIWGHYGMLGLNRDRIVGLQDLKGKRPDDKRAIFQLDDVCSCYRRDTFLKHKFSPELRYAEDLELGMRLVTSGFKIAQFFTTGVIHSHNRPPSFWLKRGYADFKTLHKILDYQFLEFDHDAWSVRSINDLFDLLLALHRSINLAISELITLRFYKYEVHEVFRIFSRRVRLSVRDQEIIEYNQDLSEVLRQMTRLIDYQEGKNRRQNPLIEIYLESLTAFQGWLVNTGIDLRNSEKEFIDTLYKLFGEHVGWHLGQYYIYTNEHGKHERKIDSLDAFLSAGV